MRAQGDLAPETYRSKARGKRVICGALGLIAVGACSAKINFVTEPVVVWVPGGCGDANRAQATYVGLGDFPLTASQALGVTLSLSTVGHTLTDFPSDTRDVVLSHVGDGGWAGAAMVPEAGPVNVLAMPFGQACALSPSLSSVDGVAMTLVDPSHLLVVGGVVAASNQAPPYIVDLGTGTVTANKANTERFRLNATATSFAGGVLVAGGNQAGEVWDDAEVFTLDATGTSGTFSKVIGLKNTRTQASAVVLPSGKTLLVGGTSAVGLLGPLEVVDPVTGTSTEVDIALEPPRLSPTVLTLPNGTVFIGGGTDIVGATVEFLTLSAAPIPALDNHYRGTPASGIKYATDGVTSCFAHALQGFATTEGGAVLAVMGPDAPRPGCSNVMLIHQPRDGSAVVIEDLPSIVPPTQVALFPGPQASPVLFDGTRTPKQWNPWSAQLTPITPGLPVPTTPIKLATVSDGLALWIGEDQLVWGLRFDTRGPYATDVLNTAYFQDGTRFTAPDRLPGADVNFGKGGLSIANGASVFVTDATFADFTATVDFTSGSPVDLVLRDPAGAETTCSVHGSATLTRAGSSVTIAPGLCSAATSFDATARVSVGLRNTSSSVGTVRSLRVTR